MSRASLAAAVTACCAASALWAADAGRIMRPVDGAAFAKGAVTIIATAPGGRLEVDGTPLQVEQPFADVFQTKIEVGDGEHSLALIWDGGREQVRFFVGEDPPEGYQPFREHPPLAGVECTQCHGVSRRGRFRFEGGCFDCHAQQKFSDAHPHAAHVLEECGLCHNAHGSTADALMIYPRETACRLCHGL